MQTSFRVRALKPSATLAVGAKAAALKAQGVDVLSFATGEPDFDTPSAIKQAAWEAMQAGQTKYCPVPGDPATRKVIAEKLTRENGIPECTPDHIVISSGGKHNLYNLFQCLLDAPTSGVGEPAQDVLLPVPAWVSYAPQVQLAGGKVVELLTTAADDFKITAEQLKRAITPRSRVLVINSPSNPCGTMYSPDELKAIGRVVAEAAKTVAPELVVISDELYEKVIFGGVPHFSLGSIPEIAERVITVNGLSKAYAMTGWRVGYQGGSGAFGLAVAKGCATLQSQSTTAIPTFILPAIRAAFALCDADVERFRQAFAHRAELIHGLAKRVPGMVCPRPTGAFYLFPDVSAQFGKTSAGGKKINSAMDWAAALLEERHVAVVPGEDFGTGGERSVRISFACSDEQIRKGMERIGEFVAGLK